MCVGFLFSHSTIRLNFSTGMRCLLKIPSNSTVESPVQCGESICIEQCLVGTDTDTTGCFTICFDFIVLDCIHDLSISFCFPFFLSVIYRNWKLHLMSIQFELLHSNSKFINHFTIYKSWKALFFSQFQTENKFLSKRVHISLSI